MVSLYVYDKVNRERDLISCYDSISEMLQDLVDHLYYDAVDGTDDRYTYVVLNIADRDVENVFF